MSLAQIMNAQDFDHVWTVMAGVVIPVAGLHAPSVEHDSEEDIIIDCEGWEAITGWSGQHGYNGSVMHPSEYIGGTAFVEYLEELAENGAVALAVVSVEVYECDGDCDPDECPGGHESAGWTVVYKRIGS